MLKIGLFSKLSRVSIRMLRYYDEIGLLHPAYIDPESDYRYYREDQLPQIGWNALDILRPNAMTEGLENGSYVYFVQSSHRTLKQDGASWKPTRQKQRGSCCFWNQPETGWERKTSCSTM